MYLVLAVVRMLHVSCPWCRWLVGMFGRRPKPSWLARSKRLARPPDPNQKEALHWVDLWKWVSSVGNQAGSGWQDRILNIWQIMHEACSTGHSHPWSPWDSLRLLTLWRKRAALSHASQISVRMSPWPGMWRGWREALGRGPQVKVVEWMRGAAHTSAPAPLADEPSHTCVYMMALSGTSSFAPD